MKNTLLLIFFICILKTAGAQETIWEFGKFSNDELELKQYSKDPTAEAVVIYDIGKSSFTKTDDGFQIIFEHRKKVKIFSKAGLKWAEIAIPFYEDNDSYEKIYDLEGNTYNLENGNIKTTPLNPKNTFTEKINDHWSEKKFAMPDVKEGSIFEITYKVRSPYVFNFRNWEFQKGIPVMYSEYTTKMIPFYEYQYILQGANKFDEYKTYVDRGLANQWGGIEYQDMVYFFVMKNVPAFKDEAFITSPQDYLIKLDFQLCAIHRPNGSNQQIMTTWPKLSQGLLSDEDFGRYLKSAKSKAEDLVATLNLGTKSKQDKIKTIEEYVKSHFKWNGQSDKLPSKSVKEFMVSKTGNSADVNLFLNGMLNAAGIEASPVISSTRSHGKIKFDYPFLHFFNYATVLAKTDSLSVMLDATEPFSNFAEIPTRAINDKGLVVNKNEVKWVSMKSNSISSKFYSFNLSVFPEGDSIKDQCKFTTTGYDAIDYRNEYTSDYKSLKKELLGNSALATDSLKALSLDKIEEPFEIDFTKSASIEKVENKLIINPFCNFPLSENPLKQPYRSYPVDIIYKYFTKYQSIIQIPKGYKLFSKPENLLNDNALMKIIYATYPQPDGSIRIIGIYEFKKDEYSAGEYVQLKENLDKIVAKFNEKVILIKE